MPDRATFKMVQHREYTITMRRHPERLIIVQKKYLTKPDVARSMWRDICNMLTEQTRYVIFDVSNLTEDPPADSPFLRLGEPLMVTLHFLYPQLKLVHILSNKTSYSSGTRQRMLELEIKALGVDNIKWVTSMEAAEGIVHRNGWKKDV